MWQEYVTFIKKLKKSSLKVLVMWSVIQCSLEFNVEEVLSYVMYMVCVYILK